jgi:hypothetical protein
MSPNMLVATNINEKREYFNVVTIGIVALVIKTSDEILCSLVVIAHISPHGAPLLTKEIEEINFGHCVLSFPPKKIVTVTFKLKL